MNEEVMNVVDNATIKEKNKMEIKNEAINNVKNLLNKYDIEYCDGPVKKIVDTWYDAKEGLRSILSKSQYWDEDAQAVILKDKTIIRSYDQEGARKFRDWAERALINKGKGTVSDYVDNLFYWMEKSFKEDLGNLINLPKLREWAGFRDFEENSQFQDMPKLVNGQKWSRFFGALCKKYELNTITDVRTEIHTDAATGELVKREKDYGYNYHMALLGDSVNPLTINGKTFVISTNLIDYLTMSFGTNWSSCHTIDKRNRRKSEHTYEGQYCGGTLAYALDKVTMITYIADEKNENKHNRNEYHCYGADVPYCLRDKEHRAVAAWDEDKLYIARVYPDDRDGGELGIGAQFREIIQQIFAECLGVSNIWTTKKGNSATSTYVQTDLDELAAYADWQHYDTGAISFLRRIDGILNEDPIKICNHAICPNCGDEHDYSDNILCEECAGDNYFGYCHRCGDGFNEDNEVYVECNDSSYCCEECANDDGYYRDHYGNWYFEDDLIYIEDNGDYYPNDDEHICGCEDDDNWHLQRNCRQCNGDDCWYYYTDDGVETSDGHWYHDEDTAAENGYVYCDDDNEWHHVAHD